MLGDGALETEEGDRAGVEYLFVLTNLTGLGFPGKWNQGPQVVDDPGLKEDEGEHTEEDKEASS